jgi:micrococcal nuclease
MIHRPHHKITAIIDGDSILVENIFNREEIEIRLYGIDAPEAKRCSKLTQDERETHIAGGFLIELGIKATEFLRNIAPVGTDCTLIQEPENTIDVYGRTLAYMILPTGEEVNRIMVETGYAKPYDKVFCEKLSMYQELNLLAMQGKKGLYSLTELF